MPNDGSRTRRVVQAQHLKEVSWCTSSAAGAENLRPGIQPAGVASLVEHTRDRRLVRHALFERSGLDIAQGAYVRASATRCDPRSSDPQHFAASWLPRGGKKPPQKGFREPEGSLAL